MPITEAQLKGAKSFLGIALGEHATGTEFVVGPLFLRSCLFNYSLIFSLGKSLLN